MRFQNFCAARAVAVLDSSAPEKCYPGFPGVLRRSIKIEVWLGIESIPFLRKLGSECFVRQIDHLLVTMLELLAATPPLDLPKVIQILNLQKLL
jgi:hypothetical protein